MGSLRFFDDILGIKIADPRIERWLAMYVLQLVKILSLENEESLHHVLHITSAHGETFALYQILPLQLCHKFNKMIYLLPTLFILMHIASLSCYLIALIDYCCNLVAFNATISRNNGFSDMTIPK